MERVAIVTRSMDDRLYDLSGSLIDLPFPRHKLTGTNADDYFYRFNDIDADWIINIDEDAFVIDPLRIDGLLKYMEQNGYDCCGVPDGGVISHRFHNPISPNPFFSIHNNKKIREHFRLEEVQDCVYREDLNRFTPTHLLKPGYKYIFDDFEPYYHYFFWLLDKGFKFLYLDSVDWPRDQFSTIAMDHLGQQLLVHTWYARDYDNQRWRFHQAVNYCRAVRRQQESKSLFSQEISSQPAATIGILTYNRLDYLKESLASALNQDTMLPFEVLIVDNGSTDGTADYLASHTDARVRTVKSPSNVDKAAGRNLGVNEARGEFILWLDDDDVLLPHALSSHFSCLQENPDADIIYANLYACDEQLNIVREMPYRQLDPLIIPHTLLFYSPFPNGGSLIRKSVFTRAGSYDPSLTRAEDYDLWIRAAIHECSFVHHDTFIYKYRAHAGNFMQGEQSPDFNSCNARAVERLINGIPLRNIFPMLNWENEPNKARANALASAALVFSKYARYDLALHCIAESERSYQTRDALVIRAMLYRAQGDHQSAATLLAQTLPLYNRELERLLRMGNLI
jgi:glycosyltransferase involved in cell wall biosynthesis